MVSHQQVSNGSPDPAAEAPQPALANPASSNTQANFNKEDMHSSDCESACSMHDDDFDADDDHFSEVGEGLDTEVTECYRCSAHEHRLCSWSYLLLLCCNDQTYNRLSCSPHPMYHVMLNVLAQQQCCIE